MTASIQTERDDYNARSVITHLDERTDAVVFAMQDQLVALVN